MTKVKVAFMFTEEIEVPFDVTMEVDAYLKGVADERGAEKICWSDNLEDDFDVV